VVEITQLH